MMLPERRTVLIAVVVCVLVACGGYALGASTVASDRQAASQRERAAGPAYAAARAGAFARGVSRGLEQGAAAGRRLGQTQGGAQGAAEGQVATQDAYDGATLVNDTTRAGGGGGNGSFPGADEAEPTASPPSVQSGHGGVLVVGDSLEVLTSPYLSRYIPAKELTVNAVGGYSSLQIFELFQESYDPSQSVIVFDAGTNDNPSYPEILAGRLAAVADIVGDRCMVVPTIHGLSVDGVNSDGKNRVVQAFAASRPGTQTPDWAGFVGIHPELMQADNLHPTAEGADARAQLIAEGVAGCQSGDLSFGLNPHFGSN